MSMGMESVSASIEYIIASMVFSLLAIPVLIHICCLIYSQILSNPDHKMHEQQNDAKLLRIAMFIWILIIVQLIMHDLILNPMVTAQITECNDGDCMYCHVFGRFDEFAMVTKRTFVILFLIQTLKYASNDSMRCLIIGLQLLTFICFLVFFISVFYTKAETEMINDNPKYMLCVDAQRNLNNVTLYAQIVRICWILIGISSLIASVLYAVITWKQITSMDFYRHSINVREKLKFIEAGMNSSIKHCVLCIQLLIINPFLKLLAWQLFMKNLSYTEGPFIQFMDAMCIYMLFYFGDKKYYALYGCIHSKILHYWKKRHHVAIEIIAKHERMDKEAKRLSRSKRRERRQRRRGSPSPLEDYNPRLESISESRSTTIDPEEIVLQ